eukprot:scaffold9635_cov96-Cyclotella_meneghiniana.AAC.2
MEVSVMRVAEVVRRVLSQQAVSWRTHNGFEVCMNNTGTIGSTSCNGLNPCKGNKGNIGANSCNGENACLDNVANIGAGTCNGPNACANFIKADTPHIIADNSCIGTEVCADNVGNISIAACFGKSACLENKGDIGFKSCDGLKSCFDNKFDIGTMVLSQDDLADLITQQNEPSGSCIDDKKNSESDDDWTNYIGACQNNLQRILDDSCTGQLSCSTNK